MPQEHWFDRFSKAAMGAVTRREIVRSVPVLLPGLLLGRLAGSASAGNNRKRKRKGGGGKNNNNHKPKRPQHLGEPDLSQDDCDAFFTEPWLQSDCRIIREQCEAPDQFCIHAIDHEGQEDLRGVACCSNGKECCIFGCTDTRNNREYCGSCSNPCGPGEVCRNRQCVCESRNCPHGQLCYNSLGHQCDGQSGNDCHCGCGGFNYCLHRDLGWVCVSGDCSLVA